MKSTEPKTYGAPRERCSERFKRSLVNRMAQRAANAHYRAAKGALQGQLDNAEMRGRDEALLAEWQREVDHHAVLHADACEL